MEILGFNRVELMMSPEDMHDAVERFNDLLGTSFEAPQLVSDGNVLTTTDWDNKIELFGPAHSYSPISRHWRKSGEEESVPSCGKSTTSTKLGSTCSTRATGSDTSIKKPGSSRLSSTRNSSLATSSPSCSGRPDAGARIDHRIQKGRSASIRGNREATWPKRPESFAQSSIPRIDLVPGPGRRSSTT